MTGALKPATHTPACILLLLFISTCSLKPVKTTSFSACPSFDHKIRRLSYTTTKKQKPKTQPPLLAYRSDPQNLSNLSSENIITSRDKISIILPALNNEHNLQLLNPQLNLPDHKSLYRNRKRSINPEGARILPDEEWEPTTTATHHFLSSWALLLLLLGLFALLILTIAIPFFVVLLLVIMLIVAVYGAKHAWEVIKDPSANAGLKVLVIIPLLVHTIIGGLVFLIILIIGLFSS